MNNENLVEKNFKCNKCGDINSFDYDFDHDRKDCRGEFCSNENCELFNIRIRESDDEIYIDGDILVEAYDNMRQNAVDIINDLKSDYDGDYELILSVLIKKLKFDCEKYFAQ